MKKKITTDGRIPRIEINKLLNTGVFRGTANESSAKVIDRNVQQGRAHYKIVWIEYFCFVHFRSKCRSFFFMLFISVRWRNSRLETSEEKINGKWVRNRMCRAFLCESLTVTFISGQKSVFLCDREMKQEGGCMPCKKRKRLNIFQLTYPQNGKSVSLTMHTLCKCPKIKCNSIEIKAKSTVWNTFTSFHLIFGVWCIFVYFHFFPTCSLCSLPLSYSLFFCLVFSFFRSCDGSRNSYCASDRLHKTSAIKK